MASMNLSSKAASTSKYAQQAEKLSPSPADLGDEKVGVYAVQATFIIPLDPVETANADRLPAVPSEEVGKINQPKQEIEDNIPRSNKVGSHGATDQDNECGFNMQDIQNQSKRHIDPLESAVPLSSTYLLFPPLHLW